MEENWDDDESTQHNLAQNQQFPQNNNNTREYSKKSDWSRNHRDDQDRQRDRNRRERNDQRDRKDQGNRNGGGFTNNDNRRTRDSSEEACKIFIETSKLGKLIGRGGSQIKDLQEKTGVHININKDCTNGDSTLVVLSGSKDAQDRVKSMIDDLLCDRVVPQYEDKPPIQIDWEKAAREHDEFQREKWAKYPPVKKNFYIEDIDVTNMPKEKVEQIRREKNDIVVQNTFDTNIEDSSEEQILNPVETFEQAFQNYPDILTEIKKQGFETPSPIQCQAWPILLSGKDMIGIAQTGTGKTLAFLLPALIHIDGQDTPRDKRCGPTVLIMAPTRELALQIEKEVNKYYYHGIKAVCVYGGGDRKQQMNTVSKGVEIVIATPGRLNDLVQTGVLNVNCVSYLVLDEADRMLDMGFEPQIRKTLLDVRPDRQTIMTSATWPPGVRRLAQSYMKNPLTVCVGSLDLKAVHSVTQKIYIIEEEEKNDTLMDFFRSMGPTDKVIVFFGKKAKVDDVGSDLALKGVLCQSIHGGREQDDREKALEDIKNGDVNILLATDVASRGIDIEDITHVFNYDFPRDIEEYVHRVGRTGRAGRTGESISLMTRRDWAQASELIKILEEAEQGIPDELYSMAERYEAMRKKRSEENDFRKGGRRYGDGSGGGGRDGGRDRYNGGGGRGGGGGRRW